MNQAIAYKLLAPLSEQIGKNVTDLSTYLAGMFKLGIGLAAAFAVLMIVWGGLEYVIAATPGGKGDGKQKIIDALLGLLLALSSYLLLYTLNPNLVKFNLSLDSLQLKTQILSIPNNIDLNNQAIAAYKTAAEKDKAVADLRLRAAEIAPENAAYAGELEVQANAIEIASAIQKANEVGSADLKLALMAINDTKTNKQFTDDKKTQISDLKNYTRKAYNAGITTASKLGNLEEARKLSDKQFYALSTIDSELDTQIELIKDAKANTNGYTAPIIKRIQDTIDTIKKDDGQRLRVIKDPATKQTFSTESADRIKRLTDLLQSYTKK
ncbi:MAG: hypothetical protein EXS50_03715 [Candidatus Taylorbacteria bacterium]|nr:hypothetical protein [Candidatus Taylorbacteria bacterium]